MSGKSAVIVYTPVGTTYKIYLPDRIRKAVTSRLVEVTHGGLNPSGNVERCVFGTEDAARQVLAEEYPDWKVSVDDERATVQRRGDRVKWATVYRNWYGERRGYVGTLCLFKVFKTSTRGDQTPYRLSTMLPEFSTEFTPYATEAEAERAAEGVLKLFLRRLGFTFED